MNLLYVITRSELGGAQAHVLDLIRGLHDRAEMVLATGEEGYLTERARAFGVDVRIVRHLVPPLSPFKDMLALRQMDALIRSVKPDLVHTHSSKAGFLGRLAARRAGVPAVFTAHGWAFADGVSWKRKVVAAPSERLASRWCDRIITVSEADRSLALQYRIAEPEKLVTIHNGIPDISHRAEPDTGSPVRIIMVARFAPPKDQELLLRALSDITVPFQAQFVGDGPTRKKVEEMADHLHLGDKVSFLGARADVATLLSESHIFVLTSHWEGFPISVLEAMRAGLPVVASDVGGVKEAVVDGKTGFLVPRGDAVVLRDRLERLIRNPALRGRMGRAARQRFERYFTVERMLERTYQVYEEVLRKDGSKVMSAQF